MTAPRPNLSADPADREPPHHDPPSKPDMNTVMLEVCRRTLDEARARAAEERTRRRILETTPL
jgi:hypothetical protein